MISADSPELMDQYYAQIGRVAVGVGHVEEIVAKFTAILCNKGVKPDDVHSKMLFRGISTNLKAFRRTTRRRLSEESMKKLEPLIDRAYELNSQRNQVIHASWSMMYDVSTGKFAGISRSRYDFDRSSGELSWDVSTPTLDQIRDVADGLNTLVAELSAFWEGAWAHDERLAAWWAENVKTDPPVAAQP